MRCPFGASIYGAGTLRCQRKALHYGRCYHRSDEGVVYRWVYGIWDVEKEVPRGR